MSTRVIRIAGLLFVAGFCALVYLTAWLRELELGFGITTRAQSAVLSVLVVGVGVGGVVLGRVADAYVRPFELFARLELVLGGFAALSPGLYWLLRFGYARLGGVPVLGERGATVLAVGLSIVALGAPAAVMGGALAAAARAVESPEDAGRHHLAMVHGGHALGAAVGTAVASLLLLDVLGTRLTIWTAALLNVGLAMLSRRFSPKLPVQVNEPLDARPIGGASSSIGPERTMKLELAPELAPATLVLGGATIIGFAFFLMHRVACRMLTPLLGATTYAYGIILAVELFGIGVGSVAFALTGRTIPPSIGRLSLGCAVQGSFLALGYGLGDRLAVLALLLRPLGGIGLLGHVAAWTLITAMLVLPVAIVLGMQIPLLVALLGRGSYHASRHVGYAYAAGGGGAIAGILAGGLAFVPLLTATGAWRLAAAMVAALGVGAMVLAIMQRQQTRRASVITLVASAVTAASLLLARGPTAAWRHGLVGSGRADEWTHNATTNSLREWIHEQRARVEWSAEGVESSVALAAHDGLVLLVDGAPVADAAQGAATQIMSGLTGAILHPRPTSALVLGLGTGGAAGWLGKVQSIERVDVIELEPALLKVARDLSASNQDVLANPKVHVEIGDPREAVNGSRDRWDLIVSDAQSPARVAHAGLFTRDFYRAAAARLSDGGIFVQRLQAYEVDGKSIRTAYATLSSVFPIVETWQNKVGDLLLVASQRTILYSAPALRARIAEEPFKTALASLWRVSDLEGLLAHYVAHPALALIINQQESGDVSTDDRNMLEFAYARGVGRRRLFDARELIATARARKENRPALSDGDADWNRVEEQRIDAYVFEDVAPSPLPDHTPAQRRWVEAHGRYAAGLLDAVLPIVRADARTPRSLVELEMIGEALADAGDAESMALVSKLMPVMPAEGGAIAARLHWRQGKLREATDYMIPSFQLYQQSPWALPAIMRRSLEVAVDIGGSDKELGRALFAVLSRPFAGGMLHAERRRAVLELALAIDWNHLCDKALEPLEPDIPWRRQLLTRRFQCYQAAGHPLAARARRDLEDFLAAARIPFAQGLADTAPGLADDGAL